MLALQPTMTAYQQRHRAYKFQVAMDVVFHKAVEPPVTLRCEMVAVYADRLSQLVETAMSTMVSDGCFPALCRLSCRCGSWAHLEQVRLSRYQSGFETNVQSRMLWALEMPASSGQCLLDCIQQVLNQTAWRITWRT